MDARSQASSELARYGWPSGHQGKTDLTCVWALYLSGVEDSKEGTHSPGGASTYKALATEGCV